MGKIVHQGWIEVPSQWQVQSLVSLLNGFIVAVTIVVVAVPEGLPLAVTISLAYSMKQMTADQNLVRHLTACETMGGVTTICSDKTGTLTQNKMSVESAYVYGTNFENVVDLKVKLSEALLQLLLESCVLNIEDGLIKHDEESNTFKFFGNTTECAILLLAQQLQASETEMKKKNREVYKWNFTSTRKMMSTLVAVASKPSTTDSLVIDTDNGTTNNTAADTDHNYFRLYTKGAPEIILKNSTKLMSDKGTIDDLNETHIEEIHHHLEHLAKDGHRVLAFGFKDIYEEKDWENESNIESDFTFIGLFGIKDPVRPDVPDSVRICQSAGITVRMITGDNSLTASKIAKDANISSPDDIILEGTQFNSMSDQQVIDIIPRLRILARSSPTDKHRLVHLLKQQGEVVAVTGDGTNDAPALTEADVGLAMGISGTEVAKQAADIIILDDNFSSIVKSVSWGRCVFENVRKFLQFQMTVNIGALAVAFIGAVTGYGTPLNAIQLLWINLIMDTFAALALGTGKPTPDLLQRKPYGRASKLITLVMWKHIIAQSLFQTILLCVLLYGVDSNGQHVFLPRVTSGKEDFENNLASTHYTIIFNVFVLCQVFNEMNCLKVTDELNVFRGFFDNPLFCIILVIILLSQLLLVEIGGNAIKTVPLQFDHWMICFAFAAFTLPLGLLLRKIAVPMEPWERAQQSDEELEQLTSFVRTEE